MTCKDEIKEFMSFSIYVNRNPKWLEPHEKQGFFLSTDFPVGDYELGKFENHGEHNIEEVWAFFDELMPKLGFKKIEEQDESINSKGERT